MIGDGFVFVPRLYRQLPVAVRLTHSLYHLRKDQQLCRENSRHKLPVNIFHPRRPHYVIAVQSLKVMGLQARSLLRRNTTHDRLCCSEAPYSTLWEESAHSNACHAFTADSHYQTDDMLACCRIACDQTAAAALSVRNSFPGKACLLADQICCLSCVGVAALRGHKCMPACHI